MSSQFICHILAFAGNFGPDGWATCDAQLLSVAENPSAPDLTSRIST